MVTPSLWPKQATGHRVGSWKMVAPPEPGGAVRGLGPQTFDTRKPRARGSGTGFGKGGGVARVSRIGMHATTGQQRHAAPWQGSGS